MTSESIYLKRHKTIPIGVLWMGTSTSDAGADDELIDTNIPVSYVANIWRNERLFIYDGTGAGQTRKIEAYDGTDTFTLYDDWITNPDTTSRYQVISGEGVSGGTAGDATAANQTTILGRHEVPAADAAANALMRDVIGNKTDDAVGAPDGVASMMAYMKAMLGAGLVDGIKNVGLNRDLPYLTEFFEDETITLAVWDETVTNSGDISVLVEAGYKFARMSTGATGVSTAVLNSDQRFEFRPNSFNLLTGVITRIVMEWDMRIANVANILNSSFLVGFGSAKTSIRTSNDVAGFMLVSDALNALTDDGGTEALTDVSSGITLSNWNKYRVTAVPGDTVQFYINDTLVATHNVAAEVPDDVMYIVIHNANDVAADADVDIAHIRQWYSE